MSGQGNHRCEACARPTTTWLDCGPLGGLCNDCAEAARNYLRSRAGPGALPATDRAATRPLSAAVALLTARQQHLPVTPATVAQLTADADLAAVAGLLTFMCAALLDRMYPDKRAQARLLQNLGSLAQDGQQ